MPAQPPTNNPMADFGPNEWLVDELYQQYLQDKNSVDQAWWEFFADYQPTDGGKATAGTTASPTDTGSGTRPAGSPTAPRTPALHHPCGAGARA